jgi:hypothetical protein
MAHDDFIKRFGQPTDGPPVVVSAAGFTDIWTPTDSLGQVRLTYLCFVTPKSNLLEVVVTALLGDNELYKIPMQAPFVWAHSMRREGAAGEKFRVNLSIAETVYVNYDLQEFKNA